VPWEGIVRVKNEDADSARTNHPERRGHYEFTVQDEYELWALRSHCRLEEIVPIARAKIAQSKGLYRRSVADAAAKPPVQPTFRYAHVEGDN
jgi:hypothetical protein